MGKLIKKIFQSKFVLALFITALFLNMGSVYLHFHLPYLDVKRDAIISTVCWLLSLILIGLFFKCISRIFLNKKSEETLDVSEIILMLFMVFVFLAIRLSRIKFFGFYLIEWYWLEEAKKIISGFVSPFGYFGDFPSNNLAFPVAFFLTFLKDRFFILRLPVVIYSLLTMIFSFKFLKLAFNKTVAFISAFLMTFSIWDINMQSFGWQNASSIPFFITVNMYFLYSGIRNTDLFYIFLSGLITGMGFNTLYIPSVIIIPSLVLLFIKIMINKNKPLSVALLIIYLVTFAFTISPNIAKFKKYPRTLARQKNSFSVILKRYTEEKTINLYIKETVSISSNFIYNKAKFSVYGQWVTTLDPVVSFFFISGLIIFILKIRSGEYLFTLLNFVVMFIPIVIFDKEGSTWRQFGFFAGIYMISSVSIYKISKLIDSLLEKSVFSYKKSYLLLLLFYAVLFVYLYQFYLKSQALNIQTTDGDLFLKSSELVKNRIPKNSKIFLTLDYPGKVIGMPLESQYKITYLTRIEDFNLLNRPNTLILSLGREDYVSERFANLENLPYFFKIKSGRFKLYKLGKSPKGSTLIYYFY